MSSPTAETESRELVEELRRDVAGEVRFDRMSRVLYSTDASIYQIEPIGVVIPRDADDVVAVIEAANRHGGPGASTRRGDQSRRTDGRTRHRRRLLQVHETGAGDRRRGPAGSGPSRG